MPLAKLQHAATVARRAAPLLLVLAALLRLWPVVLAHPAIGFGNNFDFFRQSSCTGLWEDYPDRPRLYPHPEGPVPTLIYSNEGGDALCVASWDNLFPHIALLRHRVGDHVDLREVGGAKAIAATITLLVMALWPLPPRAKLPLLAAAAVIIGDFDTASYANTLYLEFSVILASTTALFACAAHLGRPSGPSWRDTLLAAASLAWMAGAKFQYTGLALLLAMAVSVRAYVRWRQVVRPALILGTTVVTATIFVILNMAPGRLGGDAARANTTDTLLGAILPAATDRAQALQVLALPQSCASAVGQTWYMTQPPRPCPEILTVGVSRVVKLFLLQPATFFTPISTAIARSQFPASNEPARWERPADATRLRYRVMIKTSMTGLLAVTPRAIYWSLIFLTSGIGIGATIWITLRPRASYALAMIGLGGLTEAYAIVSSVFGDGYQDLHRHALLIPCGLTFVLAGVVELQARTRSPSRH